MAPPEPVGERVQQNLTRPCWIVNLPFSVRCGLDSLTAPWGKSEVEEKHLGFPLITKQLVLISVNQGKNKNKHWSQNNSYWLVWTKVIHGLQETRGSPRPEGAYIFLKAPPTIVLNPCTGTCTCTHSILSHSFTKNNETVYLNVFEAIQGIRRTCLLQTVEPL
jgi:hypothetical protein